MPDEMWPASDEDEPVIAEASVGMTVTRARPMAAAIRPYSMAVAPDSLEKKRETSVFISVSSGRSLMAIVLPKEVPGELGNLAATRLRGT